MKKFHTKIGLELHIPLDTKYKMFSPCFKPSGKQIVPQNHIDCLDLAEPGVYPVLNKDVLHKGLKIASLLHCQISKFCVFDRKHYMYPDNPTGYQITQHRHPIGSKGNFDYLVRNQDKIEHIENAKILSIHLENDTARQYKTGGELINIDYSRHNCALAEIVTEPCFENSNQVVSFISDLSDSLVVNKLYSKNTSSSLRVDVNLNLWNEQKVTTVDEIKNLYNKRAVKLAIDQLINLKFEELASDNLNSQQRNTYCFNENEKLTLMRLKTLNYAYTHEPNILPIRMKNADVSNIRDKVIFSEIPQKILNIKEHFNGMDIHTCYLIYISKNSEQLIDILPEYLEYFTSQKKINFIIGALNKYYNDHHPELIKKLVELVFNYQLNKTDFEDAYLLIKSKISDLPHDNILEIIKENGLLTENNPAKISQIIDQFIESKEKYSRWLQESKFKSLSTHFNTWLRKQESNSKIKLNCSVLKEVLKSKFS